MCECQHATGLTRRQMVRGLLVTVPILTACEVDIAPPPEPTALPPAKITFLNWWSGLASHQELMTTVAQRWQAQRPEIEVEWVGAPGPDGVLAQFLAASAANTPIDVALSAATDARDLYDAQQLLELQGYTQQMADIADGAFLQASEQFRKAGNATFGLPVTGPASRVIALSGALFEAAGLDPTGSDLKTWDDLDRVAVQLTQRRGDQIVRSGYAMRTMDLAWFTAWVNTTGNALFNTEQTWAWFNSEGAVAVLRHLVKLRHELRVSAPNALANLAVGQPPLLAGTAAMHDDLSGAILHHYREAPPALRYWHIPYPKGPGGKGPNSATAIDVMVLHKEGMHQRQAMEFCRWFSGSPEAAVLKFKLVHELSPLKAFYETPAWHEQANMQPVLKTVQAIAGLGGAYAGHSGTYPYRRYRQLTKEVLPLLQRAYRSGEEIPATLQQAHIIANRILAAESPYPTPVPRK